MLGWLAKDADNREEGDLQSATSRTGCLVATVGEFDGMLGLLPRRFNSTTASAALSNGWAGGLAED